MPLIIGDIRLYIRNVIMVTSKPLRSVKGTLNINRHVNKGGTPGIRLAVAGKISTYMSIIKSMGMNFVYTGYVTK